MAHTDRRRWVITENRTYIDPDVRDRGSDCWCCTKWRRDARRRERHQGKVDLRRAPDSAGNLKRSPSFWA